MRVQGLVSHIGRGFASIGCRRATLGGAVSSDIIRFGVNETDEGQSAANPLVIHLRDGGF